MSVLRVHRHRRDFTITTNATPRDRRLSARARGVLWFLLSQRDGIPVNAETLAAEEFPEGRDAIAKAIRELLQVGYLRRRREQDDRGHWVTVTDVFETPELAAEADATDDGFSGVGAAAGQPANAQVAPATGLPGVGEPVAMEEGRSEQDVQGQPPSVVPAPDDEQPGGEVIPLRSDRAVKAAQGTLDRLKAEISGGRKSWSLSEAGKAEWLALLEDVDTNPGPPQQFVMFYLSANTGRDVRAFGGFHWQMAAKLVRRWRGLVLYGVDQAITRIDPDEADDRGRAGRPFWAYVEAVCQRARADTTAGGGGA